MTREKISRSTDTRHVRYTRQHWALLEEKRRKAARIMEALIEEGIQTIVHGSLARGDVTKKSDIDIVVLEPFPTYRIGYTLEKRGFNVFEIQIVQATPRHTPKIYYVIEPGEEVVVSLPVARLLPREREFYYFSGALDLKGLLSGRRVPGVNKRLELIIPVKDGHVIEPVIGRESIVAEKLGVSVETVRERVRVLTRRDEIGRTGVFIKKIIGPGESIEEALVELSRKNPYLKKILDERR